MYHVPLLYGPEHVTSALGAMTPAAARLYHASKTFAGRTQLKEKWYGTDYSFGPIPDDWRASWDAGTAADASCGGELALPDANPFLPSRFDLLTEPCSPLPEARCSRAAAAALSPPPSLSSIHTRPARRSLVNPLLRRVSNPPPSSSPPLSPPKTKTRNKSRWRWRPTVCASSTAPTPPSAPPKP